MSDANRPRRLYGGHPGTESIQMGVSLTRDTIEALDKRAEQLGLTRSGTIHHLLRGALRLAPLYPYTSESQTNA